MDGGYAWLIYVSLAIAFGIVIMLWIFFGSVIGFWLACVMFILLCLYCVLNPCIIRLRRRREEENVVLGQLDNSEIESELGIANVNDYQHGQPNEVRTRRAKKSGIQIEELDAIAPMTLYCDLETNEDSCAVCLDEFEPEIEVRLLPCHHLYHSECITKWLHRHRTCPLCNFDLRTLTRPQNNQTTNENIDTNTNLQEVLVD
mmetsp:Transcript_9523/g.17182  ORF Transcript_9523/g.17182 Transcript_9523/m.17182 type:complete len:202 (+) Transcript_9523:135-740(+)